MNEKHKIAIEKVFNKLMRLSLKEFKYLLKKHEGGDFANIILETGALDVGKIEQDGFTQGDNSSINAATT